MDPLGKQELITFYDRQLKDFGDAPQAVRWTPEGQLRRCKTVLTITGDLSGKSNLDFGCGKVKLFIQPGETIIRPNVYYLGTVKVNLIGYRRKSLSKPLWIITTSEPKRGLEIYLKRMKIE